MTVSHRDKIDLVGRDQDGTAVLVLVEEREWGDAGALLPELQDKLNTYYVYVTGGRLAAEYPVLAGSPVRFELKCMRSPTQRELDYLQTWKERALDPMGIRWSWALLASA
jgi:hypothetical protein